MESAPQVEHTTESIHQLMANIGISEDPEACRLFLTVLKNAPGAFVSTKHVIPEIHHYNPICVVPAKRFEIMSQQIDKQTIFDTHNHEMANRLKECAAYVGALPALNVVSNYYSSIGNPKKSIDLMRQAHFWQEFVTLCSLSAAGTPPSFGFHYTIANLIKIAPPLLATSKTPIFKDIMRSLREWLENRMHENDLGACAHIAHLSLKPEIDEKNLEESMHKIMTLIDDDEKRFEFIYGNGLEPALELLAQKNDSLANTLLARSSIATGKWELANKYIDRLTTTRSVDVVIMRMIANLMRTIEPTLNKEQFAQELHKSAELLAQEISADLSNPAAKFLLLHCPQRLMAALSELARTTDNSDAYLLLGYLNIAMMDKEEHAHEAFSHFSNAVKQHSIDENWAGNHCARWLAVSLCEKKPTLFNKKEKKRALDLCFGLAASDSPYRHEAHDLLIDLSDSSNDGNVEAQIRTLILYLKEGSLENFNGLLLPLAQNESTARKLFAFCQHQTIEAMISHLSQSTDKLIQQKAKRLIGYTTFVNSNLQKGEPWPTLINSDLLPIITMYGDTKSYSETELSVVHMIAGLLMHANKPNTNESLVKKLHEVASWLSKEIGKDFQNAAIDFFMNNCPAPLVQKISSVAEMGDGDAHLLLGYCVYKKDKTASYDHFAHTAKANNFAKWAAIVIAQEIGLADKNDQIIEWANELASCVSSPYRDCARELLEKMTAQNNNAAIHELMLLIENDPNNMFARKLRTLHTSEKSWDALIEFCKRENKIGEYTKWKNSGVKARARLLAGYIKLVDLPSAPDYSSFKELSNDAYNNVQYAVKHKCGSREDLAIVALAIGNNCSQRQWPDEAEKWYKCSLQYKDNPATKLLWAQKVLAIAHSQIKAKKKKIADTQKSDVQRAVEILGESEGEDPATTAKNQLECFKICFNDTYGLGVDLPNAYEHLNNYYKNHSDDPKTAFGLINVLCEAREKNVRLPVEQDYATVYKLCKLAWQNKDHQGQALIKEMALAAYKTDRGQEAETLFNELIPKKDLAHLPELIYNHALFLIKLGINISHQDEKKETLARAAYALSDWYGNFLLDPKKREKNLEVCLTEDIKLIREALKEPFTDSHGHTDTTDEVRKVVLSFLTLLPQARPLMGKNSNSEIQQALLTLKQAAEDNELMACAALNYFYREGKFVHKDIEESFKYIMKIIDHDEDPSFLTYACQQFDNYYKIEGESALKICYQIVQIMLSERFQEVMRKANKPLDFEKLALKYFQQAEDLLLTKYKNLCTADFIKGACEAVKKLADGGNCTACTLIGFGMRSRYNIKGSLKELSPSIESYVQQSFEYLEKAYAGGCEILPPQEVLVNEYVNQATLFIENNRQLGEKYLEKALAIDSHDKRVCHTQAIYLLQCEGNSDDAVAKRKQAVELLQPLADKENFAASQYCLGIIYAHIDPNPERQRLVPFDYDKGLDYIKMAAKNKLPEAIQLLNRLMLKSASFRYTQAKFKKQLKQHTSEYASRGHNNDINCSIEQYNRTDDAVERADAAKVIASLYMNINKLDESLTWLQKIMDAPNLTKIYKAEAAADGAFYCMKSHQMERAAQWLKTAIQYGIVDQRGNFQYSRDCCQQVMGALSADPDCKQLLADVQHEIQNTLSATIQQPEKPKSAQEP